MRNEVSVTFRFTEQDFVSAVHEYHGTFRHMMSAVVSALFIALGLFTVYVADDSIMGWLLVLLGAAGIIQFYVAYHAGPRRGYKKRFARHEEYTMHFSDAGVAYRGSDVDAVFKWSFYSSVRETEGFYFLLCADEQYSAIPKRVFAAPGAEQVFRELLRRHLPAGPEQPAEANAVEPAEYAPKSFEPPDWR